jgi:hypothetical protein
MIMKLGIQQESMLFQKQKKCRQLRKGIFRTRSADMITVESKCKNKTE